MKKILIFLPIIGVALVFMLWKKATTEQEQLSVADATNERSEVQSTNTIANAATNDSKAAPQTGFYGTNLAIVEPRSGDPSAMKRREAADLLYLEAVVALDVRDGIDQEVREKEMQMRKVADTFQVGMPIRLITEQLGGPSVIQTNIAYYPITTEEYARGVRQQQYVQSIDFYYSPREELKLDGRNGAGFQNLLLRLDPDYQLVSWQWHRPTVFINGQSGMWYKPRD
jgi:hypothetical protein